MSVQLYIDFFSQPSRAIWAFCIAAGIPYEIKKTQIIKGEQRSPEFTKLNPNKLVPAIRHGDFTLYESHAILPYLATAFQCEDQWYPKDPKVRGRVNEYLHWHHNASRLGLAGFIFRKVIKPKLTGRELPAELEKQILQVRKRALERIEEILTRFAYIAGTEQPTIADLSLYCEFSQYKFLDQGFDDYPRINAWMKRVEQVPGIRESHELVNQNIGIFKL